MKKIAFGTIVLGAIILLPHCSQPQNKGVEEADTTEVSMPDYVSKGQDYALQAQTVLAKNLMAAVAEGGPSHAMVFCNERAIPLTDSMQTELGVNLRRVSDQNRNPDNAANAEELAYIQTAKSTLADGGDLAPKVQEIKGKMVGYYPILTNDLCLNCHGTPGETIKSETLAEIKARYPNDKAIGYAANQLRGIWVVEMPVE